MDRETIEEELDGTVFEIFDGRGLQEEFLPNYRRADASSDKYDFFWVAEDSGGTYHPQYLNKGNEQSFSVVRDLMERGELEAFYWIPTTTERPVIGARSVSGELQIKARRLGRQNLNTQTLETDKRYSYRLTTKETRDILHLKDALCDNFVIVNQDFDYVPPEYLRQTKKPEANYTAYEG